MQDVPKPRLRSPLRQRLGREYFILKRRISWFNGKNSWAKQHKSPLSNAHLVFAHQSLILRPLKDVDMYLQENKRTNLALALRHLDGITLAPGEVFSFWRQVGRPTARKGYLDGLVLNQGTVGKGTGGGLCQLGNLLFWMVAHSPLEVKERHRHGFDVFPDLNRKVPFGAGATLAYNYIDFQAYNPTNTTFQFKLWLDPLHLRGELWSSEPIRATYEVKEENHLMKQQPWGGYTRHNQIVKWEHSADGHSSASLLAENHAIMMYNPFLEGGKKETQK